MDETTANRMQEKAEYIAEAVAVLAEQRDSLTFAEYRSNRHARDIVEREFETAIEACIDIGAMLIRSNGGTVPETNAAIFRELGRRAILEDDLARRMGEAAGFRNILAHRYGNEIDDEDVFNVLQNDLDVFYEFLQAVRKTLP
jgi:uncharacterized protein YutE (UPF0331/DUF86 family)